MEYIGAFIFIVTLLYRGFKWVIRQSAPKPALPQPPRLPTPANPPAPFQASAQGQAPARPPALFAPPPARPAVPMPTRTMPRQPDAGPPAVGRETDSRDFARQEQELLESEPTGLGTSLTSSSPSPGRAVNTLFGGTDDLVRAIILSEVLGPPLSRRAPRA